MSREICDRCGLFEFAPPHRQFTESGGDRGHGFEAEKHCLYVHPGTGQTCGMREPSHCRALFNPPQHPKCPLIHDHAFLADGVA